MPESNVSRERWARVEAVFHEVVDLDDREARVRRLHELCGTDAALLAEVKVLLEGDDALRAEVAGDDPHLGLRLGAYTLTRLLGRGGMAAVYEGQRVDGTFTQRVAVKVMDLRLSDPALVAQFKAERQILAGFEHPSVTRLLDGGVTALGEPYLVMEFVDGQPIDRYCDERRLSVSARLALFAQVCDAVAAAHRTLVLHRDLKPSNILVTDEGRVKVVDFGTATLLQPDRLVTTSAAPLTPAYASPEQLTGKPVGTASDQFSLGIVLFELLTGVSPFGERLSLLAAIERALSGTTTTAPHAAVTEPAAAVRQTSLARLRRTLSDDLGTIVMKALAPDPAARYVSVQHLADDLARWSRGEPILGRPASRAYIAVRFLQRHWVASSVAAGLALALAVATAVSLQQAQLARDAAARAEAQAALARTESAKAGQMNRFLTRMLTSANPSWYNASGASAQSITIREILDGAATLIPTELGSTPDVEAAMHRTLGRTYLGLGDAERAEAQVAAALQLYRAHGDQPGIAFTEALRGELGLLTGDYRSAEDRLRGVLAYVRREGTAAVDPELFMMATNDLGVAISSQRPGDAEAIALKREALAAVDRAGTTPDAAAIAVSNIAVDLLAAGRLVEAERTFRDALARVDALSAPPPERVVIHCGLSTVLRIRGDAAGAVQQATLGLRGVEQVWGRRYFRWGACASTLGRALVAADQTARAATVLRQAYDTYREFRPADHPDLTVSLIGLGIVARRQGDLAASRRHLQRARDILRAKPQLRERAAEAAGELGLTLQAMGRRDEGRALIAESYGTLHTLFGDDHPSTRLALSRLAPPR